jgi:hypothetical protein
LKHVEAFLLEGRRGEVVLRGILPRQPRSNRNVGSVVVVVRWRTDDPPKLQRLNCGPRPFEPQPTTRNPQPASGSLPATIDFGQSFYKEKLTFGGLNVDAATVVMDSSDKRLQWSALVSIRPILASSVSCTRSLKALDVLDSAMTKNISMGRTNGYIESRMDEAHFMEVITHTAQVI